jgi:hypothetical protein
MALVAPRSQSLPPGPQWPLPASLRKVWLSGSSAESYGEEERASGEEDAEPLGLSGCHSHSSSAPQEGRSSACLPIFIAMEVIQVERKSIRCVHLCGTKEERSADRNRPGFTRGRLNKTFPQFEEDGNLDLPLNVSFFVPQ